MSEIPTIGWLAERVEPAVMTYAKATGLDDDLSSAVSDMVCDLLLFAHMHKFDTQRVIEGALSNFHTTLDELDE